VENTSYIALSRMVAQQRAMDVRADNIANMNTPGYKGESVLFSDYLVRQRDVTTPPGGRTEQMVQDRATWRDATEGQVSKTGNPLDLALTSGGYFAVSTARGERYTRAGRFSLGANGQVEDMQGNAVLGTDSRPLNIPQGDTNISIASDGTVSTESGPVGKLRVVQFDDEQSLKAEGTTLFAATKPPQVDAAPAILQGAVEGANIQPITEMTNMMGELREFEFASQFVDAEATRQQSVIDRLLRSE